MLVWRDDRHSSYAVASGGDEPQAGGARPKVASIMASAPQLPLRETQTPQDLRTGALEDADVLLRGHQWPRR